MRCRPTLRGLCGSLGSVHLRKASHEVAKKHFRGRSAAVQTVRHTEGHHDKDRIIRIRTFQNSANSWTCLNVNLKYPITAQNVLFLRINCINYFIIITLPPRFSCPVGCSVFACHAKQVVMCVFSFIRRNPKIKPSIPLDRCVSYSSAVRSVATLLVASSL